MRSGRTPPRVTAIIPPSFSIFFLNEPHGISWTVWRDGGFVAEREAGANEDNFLTEAGRAPGPRRFPIAGHAASGGIQKHRLNWTAWCFHKSASPAMLTDWTYAPTPHWGAYAKRALAGERFKLRRLR